MCECFTIGSSFIGADPDCPIHGEQSKDRDDKIEHIIERVNSKEISTEIGVDLINEMFYCGNAC